MKYFRKNASGNFVGFYFPIANTPTNSPIDSAIVTYSLPYINTNSKSSAVNGQIIINLNGYRPLFYYAPYNLWADSVQHFRYEFWIYDRNGVKSNVVTTPEFDTNYPQ